ncbi:MAG: hypothetical protein B0A82_26565 [Alkalinema sp. CACIAM 70d]|nr:MAG: hypothetical protein B0A82_26565 [Alkalinema sp. CACIAM 70d]
MVILTCDTKLIDHCYRSDPPYALRAADARNKGGIQPNPFKVLLIKGDLGGLLWIAITNRFSLADFYYSIFRLNSCFLLLNLQISQLMQSQ